MSSIKISRSDSAVKPILAACYPEWKGRKVRVKVAAEYQMSDYWSEGSRNYVRAYSLDDGRIADTLPQSRNPFLEQAHVRIGIPRGIALVEHSISCGKDGGVTIYVSASDLPRLQSGQPTPLPIAEPYIFYPSVGRTVATGHCHSTDITGPRDVWRIVELDERSDSALCQSAYGYMYWFVASTLVEIAGPFYERNPSGAL